MNTLINAITVIVNPFSMVDMGIEGYSNYCKKISGILDRIGNSHTGMYDMVNERGDAIVLVGCIIEVLSEMVLCKNPYVVDYWNRINALRPHLVNLLDESLSDDDVMDVVVKVRAIFFED